ncbi:MAG: VIT1/CCC1 transporter family protein [Acidobacteriota bacterium]
MSAAQTDVDRYQAWRQKELESVFLYNALAAAQPSPELGELYRRLAQTEQGHAARWEERLRAAGVAPRPFRAGWRPRLLAWIARRFGPGLVAPTVAGLEAVDRGEYAASGDPAAREAARDERSHARLLRLVGESAPRGMAGGALARLEGRHGAIGGNALRAAVLGANDGLLSNFSLVMGVAGAEMSGNAILVTGLAGLLAGAGSMALGEWLSVQSSRELFIRQLEIERGELEAAPAEEAEELALIYQSKGLPVERARELAQQALADPEKGLDTLAREELGIDPEELGGSAWEAAITSFFLFAVGAIIPVAPFLWLHGTTAVLLSVTASAVALFGIGALITVVTGRPVLVSGARQLLIGLLAAGLTFGIGKLLGVTVAG